MNIPEEYNPALDVIRNHFQGEIRPFFSVEFGRRIKRDAISLFLDYSERINPRTLMQDLNDGLPDGFIAFLGNDRWLGDEKHDGVEIVVAHANSKFDALRLAESRGVNQDVSIEEVIEKLKEYDAKYGVEILKATVDTVEFRLNRLPENIVEYLDDQSESMKVSTFPREKIIAELKRDHLDGFWWD